MDIMINPKKRKQELERISEKSLRGKRIEDIENKNRIPLDDLYEIRNLAKDLHKKKTELLLHEAIDFVWNNYKAKQTLNIHIENLKKIKPMKIPGTSTLMPPFDYDDPHVQIWINERIVQLRKKNTKLTYQKFLEMIAKKINCHKGRAEHIDGEEQLFIFNDKITAMASDLWDMEEFDWDAPENQWFVKEAEERERKFSEKLGKMSAKQMETIYTTAEQLVKDKKASSYKEAFKLAYEK